MNASLITGLNNSPFGVNVSGGNLFVTNYGISGFGTIGEYTLSGATVNANLITGLSYPIGTVVSGGDLFVANYFPSGNGPGNTIREYTTSGATVSRSLVTGLDGPQGLAILGSDLFVANINGGAIGEYTTSGATVDASLINGLTQPSDVVAIQGTPEPSAWACSRRARGSLSSAAEVATGAGP